MHKQSAVLHNTVEMVCLNAKTNTFQDHLRSETSGILQTLSQTFRVQMPFLNTPNKRPFEKEELQQLFSFPLSCVVFTNRRRPNEEIGDELARESFIIQDINPEIWTSDLENYIDTVLEENEENFKNKAQVKILDDYCEKDGGCCLEVRGEIITSVIKDGASKKTSLAIKGGELSARK
ncbi:58_t:CDS:2, partial [Racocetra fulgida]